jgi:hypothetical protein
MFNKIEFIVFSHIAMWIAKKLDIEYICGFYLWSNSDMKRLFEKFNSDEE